MTACNGNNSEDSGKNFSDGNGSVADVNCQVLQVGADSVTRQNDPTDDS